MSDVVAYAARNRCGCLAAVSFHDDEHPEWTTEFIADQERRGHVIERHVNTVFGRGGVSLNACADNPACERVQQGALL